MLLWPILYTAGMGLSNYIVYHHFHISYGSDSYASSMLPFIAILTAGTLICFLLQKKQLALPWTGQGKLPLFLILFLPLAGMALYYFFIGGELTKAFLLPLLTALLVGIAEEMMFRRILYVTLLRSFPEQGSKKPLFISAALFSLLHAVNIFAGSTVPQVLIQLAATFVAGLFFALMYEYTRSIFLMIATHFLWDYILLSGAVHKIPAFAIVMGLLEVMQVLIMLVLLKRKWKQV